MNVKRGDLLAVELDDLAGVGRRVVGGDHGVGLRPARVVQVWQGAGHQVVACSAGEGRHGGEGGAGKKFCSIENISDFTRSSVQADKDLFLPGREGGSTG